MAVEWFSGDWGHGRVHIGTTDDLGDGSGEAVDDQ